MHAMKAYLPPLARLLMSSLFIWDGFLQRVRPELRDDIMISHQWTCFRPWLRDGLPVVDRVPGLSNAWMTAGHFRTGVLMAPLTGQMLVRWIDTGEKPAEAHGLEAARLVDASRRLG